MTGLSDAFIFKSFERPIWFTQAKCRNYPTEIFYPGKDDSLAPGFNVCNQCPVKQKCLNFALSLPTYLDCGIWGGTSVRGRRKMRSKLKLAVVREDIPE